VLNVSNIRCAHVDRGLWNAGWAQDRVDHTAEVVRAMWVQAGCRIMSLTSSSCCFSSMHDGPECLGCVLLHGLLVWDIGPPACAGALPCCESVLKLPP
jgi:hypothetical protein